MPIYWRVGAVKVAREEEHSPQQQGGQHGNQATVHHSQHPSTHN